MTDTTSFTATEVAFVLREPVKTVRKALDDGPVRARLVKKAGAAVRIVGWTDVLYLLAVRSLRDELTPKARLELYHALKGISVERADEVRFGRLSVAIDDLKAEMRGRARELASLSRKVEFRPDGEALLKGTPIEVHRIAALLAGGMTPAEICEDFPSLAPADVATAQAYAEAYPKAGRPYPSTTAKRALKGAGLEALDGFLQDE